MPQDLKSLISELREADGKALEAPWNVVECEGGGSEVLNCNLGPCAGEMRDSEAELIVLLRNNAKRLLDAAEAGMVMRNRMAAIVATGADLSAFEQCKEALAAYDSAVNKE